MQDIAQDRAVTNAGRGPGEGRPMQGGHGGPPLHGRLCRGRPLCLPCLGFLLGFQGRRRGTVHEDRCPQRAPHMRIGGGEDLAEFGGGGGGDAGLHQADEEALSLIHI